MSKLLEWLKEQERIIKKKGIEEQRAYESLFGRVSEVDESFKYISIIQRDGSSTELKLKKIEPNIIKRRLQKDGQIYLMKKSTLTGEILLEK